MEHSFPCRWTEKIRPSTRGSPHMQLAILFNFGVKGIWSGMIGGTLIQTLILAIITVRCNSDIEDMARVEHELKLSWLAQMDHLENRLSIEATKAHYLWMGKAAYYCIAMTGEVKLHLSSINFRE